LIEIDTAHRQLILGLILSSKPKTILELGYGTGLTNQVIHEGIRLNQLGTVTVVDNFYDGIVFDTPGLVISSEEDFVHTTQDKFDFIVSDADHFNSHKWVDKTISLLTPNGIAVFHDVTCPMFPNLRSSMDAYPTGILFNISSIPGEQCERGLYIICNALIRSTIHAR
jgi:predicted O-methyltransferase YrrM